jgi:hypothetical protein
MERFLACSAFYIFISWLERPWNVEVYSGQLDYGLNGPIAQLVRAHA